MPLSVYAFSSFWDRDPTSSTSPLHYGHVKSPSPSPGRPSEVSEEETGRQSQEW